MDLVVLVSVISAFIAGLIFGWIEAHLHIGHECVGKGYFFVGRRKFIARAEGE